MEPLPRLRLLDPRRADVAQANPIKDSVNIPLEEIGRASSELPPRCERLQIAAVSEAESALLVLGREGDTVPFEYGLSPRGRLWEPSPLVAKWVPQFSPGFALDLGAGGGRDAVFTAAHGWRVLAIDNADNFVEMGDRIARRCLDRPGAIRFVSGEAVEQFTRHGSCDLLLMIRFLEKEVVARAREVVARGGHVLIQCFHPENRVRMGRPRSPLMAATPSELAELLGPAFEVLEAEVWEVEGKVFTALGALKAQ